MSCHTGPECSATQAQKVLLHRHRMSCHTGPECPATQAQRKGGHRGGMSCRKRGGHRRWYVLPHWPRVSCHTGPECPATQAQRKRWTQGLDGSVPRDRGGHRSTSGHTDKYEHRNRRQKYPHICVSSGHDHMKPAGLGYDEQWPGFVIGFSHLHHQFV